MKPFTKCLILILVITTQYAVADSNWPRWRGPDSNGSMTSGNHPVKWDLEKALWKTEVPGKGCSTPIVWDKRIYLTTGAGGLDTVIALDWSGKQIWQIRVRQQSFSHNRWLRFIRVFQKRQSCCTGARWLYSLENQPVRAVWQRPAFLGFRNFAGFDQTTRRHGSHARRGILVGCV